MRMGIAIVSWSVSGPPRVADPAPAGQRLLLDHLFQGANPSRSFPHFEPPVLDRRQPCAVIAAILESSKTGHEDRRGLVRSRVTDDSAHALPLQPRQVMVASEGRSFVTGSDASSRQEVYS